MSVITQRVAHRRKTGGKEKKIAFFCIAASSAHLGFVEALFVSSPAS